MPKKKKTKKVKILRKTKISKIKTKAKLKLKVFNKKTTIISKKTKNKFMKTPAAASPPTGFSILIGTFVV